MRHGLLLGSVLTWWLVRSISRPIGAATPRPSVSSATRENIERHNRDEAGQLLLSLNTMQEPCAGDAVRQSAQSVRLAARLQGNADLSERTEGTASSLQQTSAALEQVTQRLGGKQPAPSTWPARHRQWPPGAATRWPRWYTMQNIQQSSRKGEEPG